MMTKLSESGRAALYPQTSTRSDSNRLHLSRANSHFPQPKNPEVISTVANKGAAGRVIWPMVELVMPLSAR